MTKCGKSQHDYRPCKLMLLLCRNICFSFIFSHFITFWICNKCTLVLNVQISPRFLWLCGHFVQCYQGLLFIMQGVRVGMYVNWMNLMNWRVSFPVLFPVKQEVTVRPCTELDHSSHKYNSHTMRSKWTFLQSFTFTSLYVLTFFKLIYFKDKAMSWG